MRSADLPSWLMELEGHRSQRSAAIALRRSLKSTSFRKSGRTETNVTLIEERETPDGPVVAMGPITDLSIEEWVMPKDDLDVLLIELSQS